MPNASTALALAVAGSALMIAFMAIVSVNLARLLPQVPVSLQQIGGISLLAISVGASLALPGGVFAGQFFGEQQVPMCRIASHFSSAARSGRVDHRVGRAHLKPGGGGASAPRREFIDFGLYVAAQKRSSANVVVRRSLASRSVAKGIWVFNTRCCGRSRRS